MTQGLQRVSGVMGRVFAASGGEADRPAARPRPARVGDGRLRAAGLSPEEASRRARVGLGGATLAREQHREARGIGFADTLLSDILYAVRRFRREPLAALAVVATVALGLGLVAVNPSGSPRGPWTPRRRLWSSAAREGYQMPGRSR